jgi:hypothetical protein
VQDEAEADGGGLRAPEALLREADGGEPAAAQGASRAPRAEGGAPLVAHAPPGHHPLHVPLLRARRLHQLRGPRRAGASVALTCCWHCGVGPGPGAEALVVRGSILVLPPQPRAGRPGATATATAGARRLVRPSLLYLRRREWRRIWL